jgi:hypothetical protein
MEKSMTDKERIEKLAYELARTRYVWNHFIHTLCGGLYPQRGRGYKPGVRFQGTAEELVFEIYKIMDGEVGRIHDAAKEVGVDLNSIPLDEDAVFDVITRSTGLTEKSHMPAD